MFFFLSILVKISDPLAIDDTFVDFSIILLNARLISFLSIIVLIAFTLFPTAAYLLTSSKHLPTPSQVCHSPMVFLAAPITLYLLTTSCNTLIAILLATLAST